MNISDAQFECTIILPSIDLSRVEKWTYYPQKSGHITSKLCNLHPLCQAVVHGSILRLQIYVFSLVSLC